jgi:SET domain-containing protein
MPSRCSRQAQPSSRSHRNNDLTGGESVLLIDVYLKKSEIEGLGVFARQPVAKGEVMWEFHPEFDRAVPRNVYERTSGPMRNWLDRYGYPSIGDHDTIIFELDDARYMNHSGEPNMVFVDANKAVAMRDIAADEELTCDYGAFFPGGFEFLGER